MWLWGAFGLWGLFARSLGLCFFPALFQLFECEPISTFCRDSSCRLGTAVPPTTGIKYHAAAYCCCPSCCLHSSVFQSHRVGLGYRLRVLCHPSSPWSILYHTIVYCRVCKAHKTVQNAFIGSCHHQHHRLCHSFRVRCVPFVLEDVAIDVISSFLVRVGYGQGSQEGR